MREIFNFRIINCKDGNQVIDESLITPYCALTISQMIEYIEVDEQLCVIHRIKEKERKEKEQLNSLVKTVMNKIVMLLVSHKVIVDNNEIDNKCNL